MQCRRPHKSSLKTRTYKNFMVNESAQSISISRFNVRSKVLHRIQIWEINTTLIRKWTFRSKFLDIHPKQAYFYTFDLLEQQNHLEKSNVESEMYYLKRRILKMWTWRKYTNGVHGSLLPWICMEILLRNYPRGKFQEIEIWLPASCQRMKQL